ncbi:MAG: hypothetical protein GY841_03840 [FCB group bacterium]|nr:hypothetical protein [FCB group bacterium]
MGLRDLAALHNRAIIGNSTTGWGWPATVTDPNGTSVEMSVLSNDISATIDPETGLIVSARFASATISIAALTDAGLGLPSGISDPTAKPWIVAFNDVNGAGPYVFKVASSDPDRSIGCVVCQLEGYTE